MLHYSTVRMQLNITSYGVPNNFAVDGGHRAIKYTR